MSSSRRVACFSALAALSLTAPARAGASCTSPANAIEAENCLTGTPQATWDISGAGDATIQGFATDISVNQGGTVNFKVSTTASAWRLDIYRMGYYQGNGARLVASVSSSARQSQPACLTNSTGLIDCGNWAISASWAVPATATSGIYFARAVRTDTGGASHIFFVVRNDASRSDILFQTSDTSWQAYNDYGGNNLYTGNGSVGRAYKVSYNRPFHTRVYEAESWVMNAEYPMVRWLEANGYDVTYHTGVDADRSGQLIQNHKLWMSNGHDEYWSGQQRTNVELARAARVHLGFFSSNTVFWKTRWESSIDGSGTPYRTLVCYKETHANAVIDPADPPTWTGTWRDPRFSPPADGGRPENALLGTLFMINGAYTGTLTVPQADGRMRLWRGTTVASLSPGQTATLAPGTLGAEVDVDLDNGYRPPGLFGVSTNPISTSNLYLLDYGSNYGAGTATHRVVMYRHSSGALVFSTGTYQWSWGLDSNHDRSNLGSTTNTAMQQATVNLLADMGVQPVTLQSGLSLATASTDATPPTSSITSPLPGSSVTAGSTVTIAGTASDAGGGVVGGVEISTDGGTIWHPASGRESWSYVWSPTTTGATTIRSRAVDDSGNLETPAPGVAVTVTAPAACTTNCTIWAATTVPTLADAGPDAAVELGVKFRSDTAGTVTGVRFYKSAGNTGTHVGSLWTSTGTLLASATFSGETASGWQQVTFSSAVAIAANTVYVASYHANSGHYSDDQGYFSGKSADRPPLHALADGVSSFDGVYGYGANSTFPSNGFNGSNYWVDVVFNAGAAPTLVSIAVTPANPTVASGATQQFTATGTYSDGSTQNVTTQVAWASSSTAVATIASSGLATAVSPGTTTVSAALGSISGSTTLTVQAAALSITTASLPAATTGTAYSATLAASGGSPPYTWSIAAGLPPGLSLNASTGVISGTPTAVGSYGFTAQVTDAASSVATRALGITVTAPSTTLTIWPSSAAPSIADSGPDSAVEIGVKFRSDVAGSITGIRFYKGSGNTGTHVANLWSSTGTKLASATFSGETASGWQQVSFATPVSIVASTVYVASYHTNVGHYAGDERYFSTAGVDSPPLHALADGVSGFDGVYAYGASSAFPSNGFNATNYWVDVVFSAGSAPTLASIAVTPANPTVASGATQQFTATGTYSDGSTQNLTTQVAWASSSTAVATIASSGLATAVGAGTTTVSAALGSVSGSTTLTVQAAALSITTASLPGGTTGTAYSATLGASGGSPPYTWSIAAGLPPGLSLNASTGVISGTPTAVGSYGFTAQVTDAASSVATRALSVTITAPSTTVTIWPSSAAPSIADSGPDSAVEVGVKFRSDVAGTITGIRFYKGTGNTGTHVASLWSSTGTKLASATFSGETASGWQQVSFATPVSIAANTVYVASYHTNVGHYADDERYFSTTGVDSPPLHALADGVSGFDGVYAYGASSAFPSNGFNASNYWVDVVFKPAP